MKIKESWSLNVKISHFNICTNTTIILSFVVLWTGVCPYCGKTFKRLKGHLAHCKAKEHPEPSQHDRTATKDTLSTPPLASTPTSLSSEKARKRTPVKESIKKTLLTTKNDKESRLLPMLESLSPSTPLTTESNQSPPLMPSPVRLSVPSISQPSSSKKKTQSLADQIKMATITSPISPSASLPSPSKASYTSSAVKQTATSKQVTKGPMKQAQSKPQPIPSDQLPAAFRPVADPVTSAVLLSTRQEAGEKQPALAPETQLEGASKAKGVSSRLPLTTQMSGLSDERIPLDGVLGTVRTPTKNLEDGGLQNVYGAHARASLQTVKDTLGRSKGIGQPGKLSFLDHLQSPMPTRDWQSVETEVKGPLGVSQDQTGITAPLRNAKGIGPLTSPPIPSNQLPDTSSQVRLSPFERLPAFPPEKEGFIPAGTTYLSPPPLQGPALQGSLANTAGLIQRYEVALLATSSSVTRPVEATQAHAKESGGVKGRIIMKDPEIIIRNLKLKNAIDG